MTLILILLIVLRKQKVSNCGRNVFVPIRKKCVHRQIPLRVCITHLNFMIYELSHLRSFLQITLQFIIITQAQIIPCTRYG